MATDELTGNAGLRNAPGNAGLRNAPGNAGLRTRTHSDDASAEPRAPEDASAEPRAPEDASAEPRAPEDASAEPRVPKGARGWYSRGYLPHFDSNDVTQHVTFHLADSLPKEMIERLLSEIQEGDQHRRNIEQRGRLEALVDAGHGACWLHRADCAHIVQDALLHFDGERYRMIAWVVMPNHVHALFQTIHGWSMSSVVGSWKTFTANAIGRIIRQPHEPAPRVWHPEFWDRYIRDENHFASAVAYIHNNPVQAGLVSHPEHWPWSSASQGNILAGNAGHRTAPGNAGLRTAPGNAGHRTAPGNAGLRTRSHSEDASAEPRGPGGMR